MDTIVITVSRGWIARNLLGTDFYKSLRERFTVVVMTPAWDDERFKDSYAHPNVRFLPLPELSRTWFEEALFFFHKHLIYNGTVDHHARWGIIGLRGSRQPSRARYYFIKTLFTFLSRIHLLRDFARFIDRFLFQKKEVRHLEEVLRELAPQCVVLTNVIDDGEVALMKAARALCIPAIGFPKSWDNLSQHGFRIKPNYLVVWNEFMKEQAVRYQNYHPQEVVCVGVPQYDLNQKKEMIMSREAFAKLYGLDPDKKLIVLGSEGKLFPSDAEAASVLADGISDGSLKDAQLLIRPHYGYKNDADKFAAIEGRKGVAIDRFNEPSLCFRDAWDYSDAFTQRFVNTMRHADVLVNTASTLTLDAVCFDVPVVSTALDGRERRPYAESIERWYETDYYQKILSFSATTVVRTPEELTAAVSAYLSDPSLRRAERMRLRDAFTYRHDGKAGERFARFVSEIASRHNSST